MPYIHPVNDIKHLLLFFHLPIRGKTTSYFGVGWAQSTVHMTFPALAQELFLVGSGGLFMLWGENPEWTHARQGPC